MPFRRSVGNRVLFAVVVHDAVASLAGIVVVAVAAAVALLLTCGL